MLAMVHSGVGVAMVPATAMNLQFSNVALRPICWLEQRPVELFFVCRDDNDNPCCRHLSDRASCMPRWMTPQFSRPCERAEYSFGRDYQKRSYGAKVKVHNVGINVDAIRAYQQ